MNWGTTLVPTVDDSWSMIKGVCKMAANCRSSVGVCVNWLHTVGAQKINAYASRLHAANAQ